MRTTICLAAALAFCASAAAAKPAAFDIKGTTWTFVEKKDGKLKESIDADGNYITNKISGKHLDHGTAVMKDGKACFTSAASITRCARRPRAVLNARAFSAANASPSTMIASFVPRA